MKEILTVSLARLLRPVVRILIRHGFSYGEFSEVARRTFVEIADRDFQLNGRKQTNARIAMLTGIQRKEVSRLKSLDPMTMDELDEQYSRGVRVISGWRRDRDFRGPDGTPMALPFEGDVSFSELVRRYSGDLTARAVLDEFGRVGTVTQTEDGRIAMTPGEVFAPAELEAQINIMGTAGSDLMTTIDHNFESTAEDRRLQLSVAYDNLPGSAVRRFQYLSHEECLALLKRFDVWLAKRDRDTNPDTRAPAAAQGKTADSESPDANLSPENKRDAGDIESTDRYRAGIGIYYFEEKVERPE